MARSVLLPVLRILCEAWVVILVLWVSYSSWPVVSIVVAVSAAMLATIVGAMSLVDRYIEHWRKQDVG